MTRITDFEAEEAAFGGFYQDTDNTDATILFERKKGSTIGEQGVGIDMPFDHTTFTAEGTYAGINANSAVSGDKAWLMTADFQPASSQCFVTLYHQANGHLFNAYTRYKLQCKEV
jgi:hypothetical protein